MQKQLQSDSIFEKPLPATLARLGVKQTQTGAAVINSMENENASIAATLSPAVVVGGKHGSDALGSVRSGAAAPRSPTRQPLGALDANAAAVYVPASPVELGLCNRQRRGPSPADVHGTFAASLRPDDAAAATTTIGSGSGKKLDRRSRNATPQAVNSTSTPTANGVTPATPGTEESAINISYNIDAVHPSGHGGGEDGSATKKLLYETPQKAGLSVNASSNSASASKSGLKSGGSSNNSNGSRARSRGGTPASRLARRSAEKEEKERSAEKSTEDKPAFYTPSKIPVGLAAATSSSSAKGGTPSEESGTAPAHRSSPKSGTPSRIPPPTISPTATAAYAKASPEVPEAAALIAGGEDAAAAAPTPVLAAATSPNLSVQPQMNNRLQLLKKKVRRHRSTSRSREPGDMGGGDAAEGADADVGEGVGAAETSMLRTASAGTMGVVRPVGPVGGMHSSHSSQSQKEISVTDSNGNLILNGEYSGPGALKAPPRSAPVLRGRRPRSRYAGNPSHTEADALDNNCVFDPVTGEVRSSHANGLPTAGASGSPPVAAKDAVGAIKKRRPRDPAPATGVATDSNATAIPKPALAVAKIGQDTSEHLVSFADAANMPGAYAPGAVPPPLSAADDDEASGAAAAAAAVAAAATVSCPTCARNFNAAAAARHIKICKAVFVEKPRKFDGSAKRIEKIAEINAAPEVASYNAHNNQNQSNSSSTGAGTLSRKSSNGSNSVRSSQDSASTSTSGTSNSTSNSASNTGKKSSWKRHSEQLRRAMQSMKKPQAAKSNSSSGGSAASASGGGEGPTVSTEAVDGVAPPANTPVNRSIDTTTAAAADANVVVEAPVDDFLTPCPHCRCV